MKPLRPWSALAVFTLTSPCVALALALVSACSGGEGASAGDGGADVPSVADGGTTTDATTPSDAGRPLACGDGKLDDDELCDSDTVACTSLAGIWSNGQATCRRDCSGYDVAACGAPAQRSEVVYPAKRMSRFADAKCNDGTPFDFEISPSPSGSHKWVLYFQGGGFCDGTYQKCVGRPAGLTSSVGSGEDRAVTTVFDDGVNFFSRDAAVNPEFFDANLVRAHYCSSDLWVGTNGVPQAIKTKGGVEQWVFTGHRNATAFLDVLRRNYGLDDMTSDILVAGGSAGGFGASQNVDQVVDRLPRAAADARIAFMASSFWNAGTWNDPDYTMFGSGKTDLVVTGDIMSTFKGIANSRCSPLATAQGLPASACLSGPLVYSAITGPAPKGLGLRAFIGQNRTDQLYMSQHVLPLEATTLTAKERAARDAWKEQMTASMASVAWLYAPADPNRAGEENLHGIFNEPALWTYDTGGGVTMKSMVSAFWKSRTPGAPGQRALPEGDLPHGNIQD